ncbi:hypothetical protein ACIPWL_30520 [Streptomyces sp. NPDC090023]|uniref:hypothetical protein n=1 Tax=unclassified Streptomyces TaxID=2593676 RepID=UPI0037F61109
MTWMTKFGESHDGYVGAVLPDGSEPKPVYLDPGSGADFRATKEWWAYNGELGRPKAAFVRACCACGWRGASYPIDWERLSNEDDVLDVAGPYEDWSAHIEAVERATVPFPVALDELLEQLETVLDTLAEDAPAAALRAAEVLGRLSQRTGRLAAGAVPDDGPLQWEALGTALGVAPEKAHARVTHYRLLGAAGIR